MFDGIHPDRGYARSFICADPTNDRGETLAEEHRRLVHERLELMVYGLWPAVPSG